ncbi:UNVERIFIED_CONTAM: hypothetical protein GTU68_065061, partial [Idotea baltica]|nr:hypothetical protein [Idotea baltica]
ELKIYQIDSFADSVFSGNPAAVCPLSEWLPDDLMKKIAAENNLSETAFFAPKDSGYEDEIRKLSPNMSSLLGLPYRGVIATSKSKDYDFVSRWFGPNVGVDEDPVTGSAHTSLAPYWADKLGQNSLRAKQISARGGELTCEVEGERVFISGRAVKYLEGVISL